MCACTYTHGLVLSAGVSKEHASERALSEAQFYNYVGTI